MIWKFDYIQPVFVCLMVFIVFFISRPRLNLKNDKAFLLFCASQIFVLITDFVSSYFCNNFADYTAISLYIWNILFFLSCIVRNICFLSIFWFMFDLKKKEKSVIKAVTFSLTAIWLFLTISAPLNGWLFSINAKGAYERGSYYMPIYYSDYLYYIGLSAWLTIKNRHNFSRREFLSSLACFMIIFVGCFVRIMMPSQLVMNMFFFFTTQILFIVFENPEINLEPRTQLFTAKAFEKFIKEKSSSSFRPVILAIEIKSYDNKRRIYGGKQMDLVLGLVGKFIRESCPRCKSFCLKGDQFLFVCDSHKMAESVKKLLFQRFSQTWSLAYCEMYLGINMFSLDTNLCGSYFSDCPDIISFLFEDFDNHEEGKFIEIDKSIFAKITRNSQIRKILHKALDENLVQVYYQPIVDAKSRKIIAAEALARLYDKEFGTISPAEFIPIAEKNGSIERLDEQVLGKVCQFISSFDIEKHGLKWINVNVSPLQCQNRKLSNRIQGIIDSHSVSATNVHLEITEESFIDSELLERQMKLLIARGYDFSLDDYGTGFSNIMRVKKLPFSNIKIDMQIVREHFALPDIFLPGTVQFFSEKGLSITAEGVETKEMADVLEAMGCNYLQGFYFSKPLPEKTFIRMLKRQHSREKEND